METFGFFMANGRSRWKVKYLSAAINRYLRNSITDFGKRLKFPSVKACSNNVSGVEKAVEMNQTESRSIETIQDTKDTLAKSNFATIYVTNCS